MIKLWLLEGICYTLAILVPLILGGVFVNEYVTNITDAYSTGIVSTSISVTSFLTVAYGFGVWYGRINEEE